MTHRKELETQQGEPGGSHESRSSFSWEDCGEILSRATDLEGEVSEMSERGGVGVRGDIDSLSRGKGGSDPADLIRARIH